MSDSERSEEIDDESAGQEPEADVVALWPGWTNARNLLFVFLIIGGAAAGLFLAWQNFGPSVADDPQYLLSAESIELTPRPAWVRSDVRAEVVRDAGLDKLNLLAPQVTVQVAQAFATHTWVAEVRRVSKQYPGKVLVDVVYRKPVAMVEVKVQDKPGLLPIDADAVLLPPGDFTNNEANFEYIRISLGDSVPAGPVGTKWGDPRVAGAARIAEALAERAKELHIYRIVPATSSRLALRDQAIYDLETRFYDSGKEKYFAGSRILWGHAPGEETSHEATASQKVARLVQFAAEQGESKLREGIGDIDVRDGQQIRLQPRTARREP